MDMFPITQVGLKTLEDKKNKLKNIDRPSVIKAIAAARDLGDLSENAEYHAAREQQGQIEAKIKFLENIIASSKVIEIVAPANNTIIFGATVTIIDLDTDIKKIYQIVGEYEADIESGLISYKSPLGHELIGKKAGDIIDVNKKSWEIAKVVYK